MPAYAMHLTDADLVRHVDAEGDPEERARREAHLEGCAHCDRRISVLRRQSEAVHDWLVRSDASRRPGRSAPRPHPTSRRRRPASAWLRAAAIVLVLATPLAAFPPVREWVATRVGLRTAPESPAQAPLARTAPVIRFVPAPGTFTVWIDADAAGTLAIGRTAGSEVELSGAGRDGAAAPIISEDGIRIPADADARYRLTVPARTTDIMILHEGGTIRVSAADIDGGRVVAFPTD